MSVSENERRMVEFGIFAAAGIRYDASLNSIGECVFEGHAESKHT